MEDPGVCCALKDAFRLVTEDNATFQDNLAVSLLISKRRIAGYADPTNNRFPSPAASPTCSFPDPYLRVQLRLPSILALSLPLSLLYADPFHRVSTSFPSLETEP